MPPAARYRMASTTVVAHGCRPMRRGLRITMDGLAANNGHDELMLANPYSTTGAHRGFRAIHKMSNVRFLSGVIWGIPG